MSTVAVLSSFQVPQTELAESGRSFLSTDLTGSTNINTLNEDETAAAFLPASLFKSLTDFDNVGSFYIVYQTGALFPITNITEIDQETNASVTTAVASPVLAATVGLQLSFSELEEPVRILLRLNELGVSNRNGVVCFNVCELSLARTKSMHENIVYNKIYSYHM